MDMFASTTVSPVIVRVIFDDEFRKSFLDDPDTFQKKYDLSDEEIQALTRFSPERVEEMIENLSSMDYDESFFTAVSPWCNTTLVL